MIEIEVGAKEGRSPLLLEALLAGDHPVSAGVDTRASVCIYDLDTVSLLKFTLSD